MENETISKNFIENIIDKDLAPLIFSLGRNDHISYKIRVT